MAKKLNTKKSSKKVVKKLTKKVAKKVAAKKNTKSPAKKAVAKAQPKKAAKKVVKKTAKKAVKKVIKKVVKATSAKNRKSVKPLTTKKPISKKAILKKIVSKPVKKAVVKKTLAPKTVTSKVKKPESTIDTIKNAVAGFVKKTVNNIVEAVSHTEPKFVGHKTGLKAGDSAPYFEGKDQEGSIVSLSALAGKTIILYFYPKDDTPGCTATACSLRDEYKYLSQSNYAVVGVSADDEKSHAKFAAKYELPFPLIADTDLTIIKAYDVWGTKQFMGKIYDGIIRTTFVIGPDGIIKEVITKVDTASHAQQILGM